MIARPNALPWATRSPLPPWWGEASSRYDTTPCPSASPSSGRPCQLTTGHRVDHLAAWQDDDWAGHVESWPSYREAVRCTAWT